jgi:hypothetical protein
MAWLSRITPASGYLPGVLGPMALFGTGVGLCFMPLNMMIIAGLPRGDYGAASGLLQTMLRIGSSVGVAVLVTVFGIAARHAAAHPQPDENLTLQARRVLAHGIAAGFTLRTIFCLYALILAVTVIQSPRRGQDAA